MSEEKWEAEREIALRFLSLRGHQHPVLHRPTGPHPDVIWDGPLGIIGLEVSRIFSDQLLVQRESLRERILDRATAAATQFGAEDLIVSVHWHQDAPIPQQSDKNLAEELIGVIQAHLPPVGESVALGADCGFDIEFIHPTFDRIAINRSIPGSGIGFASGYFEFGHDMTAEHLLKRINDKSRKRRDGMQALAAHWLVLYGAYGPLSSYLEPLPPALELTYRSAFDRVFLALINQARVWELPTAPIELGA